MAYGDVSVSFADGKAKAEFDVASGRIRAVRYINATGRSMVVIFRRAGAEAMRIIAPSNTTMQEVVFPTALRNQLTVDADGEPVGWEWQANLLPAGRTNL